MGILTSLLVGLLAGTLASWLMPGGGRSWLINLILGLLGGIVGGWVFGLLDISTGSGAWGTLITSTVGAAILIWIGSLFKKK